MKGRSPFLLCDHQFHDSSIGTIPSIGLTPREYAICVKSTLSLRYGSPYALYSLYLDELDQAAVDVQPHSKLERDLALAHLEATPARIFIVSNDSSCRRAPIDNARDCNR